jgi:hypothetical protein
MGLKDDILSIMKYDSLTITEIHARIPRIASDQIRIYLHRLMEEGYVHQIGEKGNQRLYRCDNYYTLTCESPNLQMDQYPDINVDLQALQIAEQLIRGPMKKFLDLPKMESINLGRTNPYKMVAMNTFTTVAMNNSEEQDLIQPKAIEVLKTLLGIPNDPSIIINKEFSPASMEEPTQDLYYRTKIEGIFWQDTKDRMIFHDLVRQIPTKSLKSGEILDKGPYLLMGAGMPYFDFFTQEELTAYRNEKEDFENNLKNQTQVSMKDPNEIIYASNIFNSTIKPKAFSDSKCLIEGKQWYFSPLKGIQCIGFDLFPIEFEEGEASRSDRFECIDRDLFYDKEVGVGNEHEFIFMKDHILQKYFVFLFCDATDHVWMGCEVIGPWQRWFLEGNNPQVFVKEYYMAQYWKNFEKR